LHFSASIGDASSITPQRLEVLSALLDASPSLLSLNAPQEALGGLTPLAVAVKSGSVHAVRLLLETSARRVALNAADATGATALTRKSRPIAWDIVARR
jgi:ankyrin repeat protein